MSALILAALVLFAAPCLASGPQPGTCHTGLMPSRGADVVIRLCLFDGSFFVLSQSQFAKGKKRALDTSGTWRFPDTASTLILANRDGFSQKLAVGSNGRLYGDFFAGRSNLPQSVTLEPDSFSLEPFSGSGILKMRDGSLILEDAASGRPFVGRPENIENYSLLGDQGKNALEAGRPLFAEARLLPEEGGGKIVALRHVSEKLPGRFKDGPSEEANFAQAVAKDAWSLVIPGFGETLCRFELLEKKEKRGKKREKKESEDKNGHRAQGIMEITGRGFRLEAPFEVNGKRLDIKIPKRELARLEALGAREFGENLRAVENWRIVNGALVLKADGIADIIMENIRPMH